LTVSGSRRFAFGPIAQGEPTICSAQAAIRQPTRNAIVKTRFLRAGIRMAIYHLSVKTVSRGKGQSAVAKAAYNSRENIRDERTGELKNYTRRAGLLFSGIFAPKDAPEWANDRAALWNAVERREDESKRRTAAQLAREITIALPHELTDKQRQQLVTDFVREQFMRRGMVADVNIHAPAAKGDQRNHHAHILLTMREIGPEGFGEKQRDWNSREQITKWRDAWERIQNRYLERYGHDSRVDQRSLDAQGVEREPTTHLGPQAHAMEKEKGVETERGKLHRENFDAAREIEKLKRELAEIDKLIARADREQIKRAQAQIGRDEAQKEIDGINRATTNDLKRDLEEIDRLRANHQRQKETTPTQPKRKSTAFRLHFEDAAHEATRNKRMPHVPSDLRGTPAEIWKAYNLRTWEQKWKQPDGTEKVKQIELKGARDPYQFAATLEAKGIALAQITKEEANRSRTDAQHWKLHGEWRPVYGEGEFVAVNKRGDVFRFTEKNTGHDRQDVQSFLNKAEWHGINGLDATRRDMEVRASKRDTERQTRSEEIAAARFKRATNLRNPLSPVSVTGAKKVIKVAYRIFGKGVNAPNRPLGKGVNLVGGSVSAFTKAFESLFTPPPKPPTRAQVEEQNKRSDNAARDQAEIAGKQNLYAAQQERIDNASRERADADRQRDAENWRKQQQDRGGRER
jgi:MobA/MobL family